MLQASALSRLARAARNRRDLNIICFTGYSHEQLKKAPPDPGVHDLLGQVDVLIDGPYIARLNDNRGLRGSANQRIHHLTGRLTHENLDSQLRKAEIHLLDGQAMLIGVPPAHLSEAFHQAVDRANQMQWELLHYERI